MAPRDILLHALGGEYDLEYDYMNCLAPAIGPKHEASRTRSKLKTAGFAQFITNPLTVAWAREKQLQRVLSTSLNWGTTVYQKRTVT
jgi:hypothetical protein